MNGICRTEKTRVDNKQTKTWVWEDSNLCPETSTIMLFKNSTSWLSLTWRAHGMFEVLHGIQCSQSHPFWNPYFRLRSSNLNFLHYACRLLCEIYIFRFDLQYSQYIFHSCISQVTLSFLHRLNQLLLFYRFFFVQELFLLFRFILVQPVCEEQSLFCCFFLLTAIFFLFSLLVLSFWTAGR